ncbi:TOMM precursor leader peptide-binding protein [Micromonospora tarensis]|uniref:TOMM leader peptide-binding protein n=1 Tax=Micromonospora tarensis TaxID=2806100 RepID=A0ABS1YCM3_9ACTN|nr:TOMM precursor leader peptide-binding protein [Micromonospora tarensis]MBM0274981.1 TOMM precursor leader peptide-binding protein [Micromonospora tarensis]
MTDPGSLGATGLDARPRLRGDVVWLPSEEGVYVRSAQAAMLLRGSSTYRLMSTISPYLTGDHSVSELCAGLPKAQSVAVANLVQALIDRGMAHDFAPPPEAALPPALTALFADQIAFLGHFADDPVARFLSYRSARVVAVGAGEGLHALATGLLRNGLGTLRLSGPAADDPYRRDIEAEASAMDATVEVTDSFDDADVVVYCADEADLALVAELARRCRAAGIRFLPAVLRGQRAVLGPFAGPATAGCWTCAQLRLAANDPPAVAADTWRAIALGPISPDQSAVTGTVSRMIGNAAAFDVFRELSGALPPETRGAVVVQEAVTLEASLSRLIAHPHCPTCAGSGLAAEPPDPDESEQSRYERLAGLIDPRTGIFSEFTDDQLRQSPLPTGRLRVAPPAGYGGVPREFVAFDVETVLRARMSAIRVAVGHYADLLAAVPTRVTRSDELDAPTIRPEQLATWAGLRATGPDERTGWIRAISLVTGEPRYVPAAAAFPNTSWNRECGFEVGPAGIGVGNDPTSAADAGLRNALAYQCLERLLRGQAPVAALDPAALGDDTQLAFLRDCLGHLGHAPVLRLVDDGPVPVVLAGLDQPDESGWRVGVGEDRAEAVRHALTQLLGSVQVATYHDEPVDLGDPLIANLPPVLTPTVVPHAEVGPAGRAALLDHLNDHGHDALFVATTPADVAAIGGYHCGRVLISGR